MSDFVSNLGTFKPSTFSGDKPKSRMAGDYLTDFTSRYSDNSKIKDVTKKDYRGNVKNNNVSSFLGNSAPKSVTQQPTTQKPEKEMSSMPVGEPAKVKTKPANTSANQQKYTVDQIWDRYVQADRAQTGTTAEKNQGSINGYWKAQDEIKSLRSQGLLIDDNGNVITG